MKLRGWQIEDGEWRASVLECGGKSDTTPLWEHARNLETAGTHRPCESAVASNLPAQSKTSRSLFAVFVFAVVFTFVLSAHAQSFTNYSFAIGGGGTSTGGVYSATGTIGQSNAGASGDGTRYSVNNGFWGLVAAVQMPGSPPLTIFHSGTSAVISWSASFIGFVLERNSDLNNFNGWANPGDSVVVLNGQNTVTVPVSGYKYYRLKK